MAAVLNFQSSFVTMSTDNKQDGPDNIRELDTHNLKREGRLSLVKRSLTRFLRYLIVNRATLMITITITKFVVWIIRLFTDN